jgi:hypothetical protein
LPHCSKANWVWISYTCELWNLVGMLGTIRCKVVITFYFKSCLSLSSTKGQYLNSCPTYWFKWICYHFKSRIISTWNGGIIGTCGHSICAEIGVASQTCWLGGCPCHTLIGIVDASTSLTWGKKSEWEESLHFNLHNCSNQFINWLCSNYKFVVVGSILGTCYVVWNLVTWISCNDT